jgi:hypothetical protein
MAQMENEMTSNRNTKAHEISVTHDQTKIKEGKAKMNMNRTRASGFRRLHRLTNPEFMKIHKALVFALLGRIKSQFGSRLGSNRQSAIGTRQWTMDAE